MRNHRIGIGAVAALVVVPSFFFTSTADAGTPDVRLTVGKNPDGPFTHTLTAGIGEGDVKNYYFKAKNTTGSPIAAELRESSSTFGFDAKYFRKDNNITDEVVGSGFPFNIKGGKVKLFRARVKRQVGSNLTGCVFVELNILDSREDAAGISFNISSACT